MSAVRICRYLPSLSFSVKTAYVVIYQTLHSLWKPHMSLYTKPFILCENRICRYLPSPSFSVKTAYVVIYQALHSLWKPHMSLFTKPFILCENRICRYLPSPSFSVKTFFSFVSIDTLMWIVENKKKDLGRFRAKLKLNQFDLQLVIWLIFEKLKWWRWTSFQK